MVKKAKREDIDLVVYLANLLWTDASAEDLKEEFTDIFSTGNTQVFLKYVNEKPVGFAQCQLRNDYVEGTETSPVGYLEGIFVMDGFRNKGFAKELLSECEAWAKEKGCVEFASDCELDNRESLCFHMAMGFTEANRIICFTKNL